MFNLINLPISGLKALLVIVLFFYSLKMPAQKVSESSSKNFEYTVSKPYRVVDALVKDYFHYGESIIAVKRGEEMVTIQRFSKASLIQTAFHEYKIPINTNNQAEGFLAFKDRLCIFYSIWDKSNKKEQLFSREISYETGEFIGNEKLLLAIDGKINSDNGKFHISSCWDSSKFMIQCLKESEYKDDSKNVFRVGLYVFDMSLKKIWGREIEMPYTEKKMDLSDFALDSKGNAYILAKVYNNNSTKEKVRGGIVNYHFEILMANANKDLIITKVNLGEKFFVSSIIMLEGPKENMICVGYSKSGDYYTNVNGLFKFNVKIGTEIIEKITYDIPIEIINQNVSGYQKFKNESKESNNDKESVGIYNLLMKKLIIDSDGSLIVIGEREFTEYSSNGKSSSTTYCFDDILITKIDSTGKLEWMKKLPKIQRGGRHGSGSSFKWIYSGENHYLLYLDNIKNLQLPIDKVPEVHVDGAGGYLTSYKIEDATGAVEKAAVFDTRNADGIFVTQFRTDRIFSIGDNEFLIEMYKKKNEDVMIRVKILNQ